MFGPIFMGVSHTWRLPFMYWNQQTADYYAGHCKSMSPCASLTRENNIFRKLLKFKVHYITQLSISTRQTFANFQLFILSQIFFLIHSSFMASSIDIGKIVWSEKKLKAIVNINLITVFVKAPFDFFFYETPVNPKK